MTGFGAALALAGLGMVIAVLIVNVATAVPRSVRSAPTRPRRRHRA